MPKQKPMPQHLYGRFRFVEDPEGMVHNVGDENAIDLIRHLGWTDRGLAPDEFAQYVPPQPKTAPKPVKVSKPVPAKAVEPSEDDDGEEEAREAPALVPEKWAADDPKAPLYELRKQALALGVTVTHAMGKRSLEKAIADAQAKKSSPAL